MRKTLTTMFLAASVLAACGGSNDDPPATESVPASASASADGFIAYLRLLVASAADMLEPVETNGVLPPADDSAEPQAVD